MSFLKIRNHDSRPKKQLEKLCLWTKIKTRDKFTWL